MKIVFIIFSFVFGYLNASTIDQKIGKLFCVPACPEREFEHRKDLEKLIRNYHVRSFILKQGTIKQAKELIKWLKETSVEPILIVVDAEWGLAMRISDAPSYPKNETLAKLSYPEIYNVGKSIAKDCKSLGIQLNLAPVVDVNSNPNNLIIGARSFGSSPKDVAEMSYFIAKGMKDEGLAICLKHFPGHGDVSLDSHKGLPISNKTLEQLYKDELLPYIALKELLPDSVMIAHILFNQIDSKYPATLSVKVVNFLKNLMGDDILIISDALNMKALTNHYKLADIATLSHTAGVDLLLYGDHIAPNIDKILKDDIPTAIKALKKLYKKNMLDTLQLDKTIQKIDALAF